MPQVYHIVMLAMLSFTVFSADYEQFTLKDGRVICGYWDKEAGGIVMTTGKAKVVVYTVEKWIAKREPAIDPEIEKKAKQAAIDEQEKKRMAEWKNLQDSIGHNQLAFILADQAVGEEKRKRREENEKIEADEKERLRKYNDITLIKQDFYRDFKADWEPDLSHVIDVKTSADIPDDFIGFYYTGTNRIGRLISKIPKKPTVAIGRVKVIIDRSSIDLITCDIATYYDQTRKSLDGNQNDVNGAIRALSFTADETEYLIRRYDNMIIVNKKIRKKWHLPEVYFTEQFIKQAIDKSDELSK